MESKKVSVVSPFIEKVFGDITVALLLLAGVGLLLTLLAGLPAALWLTILGLPGGLIVFVLIMIGYVSLVNFGFGEGVTWLYGLVGQAA